MNQVAISGNLVEPPRVNTTQSGLSVASLRVAHNKPDRRDGTPGGTVFVSVTAWADLADAVAHLPKGAFVMVYGNLDEESWTSPEGQPRSKVVIKAQAITGRGIAFTQGVLDYEPGRNQRPYQPNQSQYQQAQPRPSAPRQAPPRQAQPSTANAYAEEPDPRINF